MAGTWDDHAREFCEKLVVFRISDQVSPLVFVSGIILVLKNPTDTTDRAAILVQNNNFHAMLRFDEGGNFLDATLILIAFRHGLRAAEIARLEWQQVKFGRNACLHVRRVKNGSPSIHPLQGDELQALREINSQCQNAICL